MIQHFMDFHRCELGGLRRGNPQHLRHNRVDALQFAPDHFGQFRVRIFFCQQVNERLDGDHAVFDFVRHARRKQSEIRQPVEPLHFFFGKLRGIPGNGIFQTVGFSFESSVDIIKTN